MVITTCVQLNTFLLVFQLLLSHVLYLAYITLVRSYTVNIGISNAKFLTTVADIADQRTLTVH